MSSSCRYFFLICQKFLLYTFNLPLYSLQVYGKLIPNFNTNDVPVGIGSIESTLTILSFILIIGANGFAMSGLLLRVHAELRKRSARRTQGQDQVQQPRHRG